MKFVLAISLCLFFGFNAFAQAEQSADKSEVSVGEILLTRDSGNTKAGDADDKFTTTDIPIHCFIQLDSSKPTTLKMNLIAVRAAGLKPETKIVTISYTTKENENQVNFNASPNGVWAAGDYRVDIFVDGKLAKSRSFEIEKSLKEIKKEKPITPKLLAPRKSIKKTKN